MFVKGVQKPICLWGFQIKMVRKSICLWGFEIKVALKPISIWRIKKLEIPYLIFKVIRKPISCSVNYKINSDQC